MRTIGALTIGQSPRDDLLPEFEAALGVKARIVQLGALDGLDLAEVRSLAPRAGDTVLVTRMREGTEVKVAERHILERLAAGVADLEARGVDLIVLWCTGVLPDLSGRRLLVAPDRLIENVVRAILPRGKLAAVVPSPDQVPALERRWAAVAERVVVESVSPYSAGDAEYEAAALRVAGERPDLVVLDCIGFTEGMRAVFRRVTGKPVLLPRSLLARVVGELIA